MSPPVGELIKNILTDKKIVYRRFGDHMGLSERSLHNFFSRDDITISQLVRASEFLKVDLTQYYRPKIPVVVQTTILPDREIDEYRMLIEIRSKPESLENLPKLIASLRTLAEEHGFDLA